MLDRNVREIGIALCLLTLFIFLSGCGSLKDDTLLAVNAVITAVDTGKQTITVKDDADENTLGEECLIDCSSTPMVYCDFATQKVTRISFEEGGMLCSGCAVKGQGREVESAVLYVLQYVSSIPLNRLYSFTLKENIDKEFEWIVKRYFAVQAGHRFKSAEMLECV